MAQEIESNNVLEPQTIVGKYEIVQHIGDGRGTKVYAAKLRGSSDEHLVALKIPTLPSSNTASQLEARVYSRLPKGAYYCELIETFIWQETYFVLVLEKVGRDLNCVGKEISEETMFGKCKGYLIGVEMIMALKALHHDQFCHGDVKSNNFCFFPSETENLWSNNVKIIDFGTTRPFVWPRIGFGGSTMFCSLATMSQLHVYTPLDDLWSALFTIIDLSTGALPWKIQSTAQQQDRDTKREIARKGKIQFHKWCQVELDEKMDLPEVFQSMGATLLAAADEPTNIPYFDLITLLQEAAEGEAEFGMISKELNHLLYIYM